MLESLFYDLVAEITPLLVTLPDKPEEDGEATVRQLGEHDQQDLKQLQPQTRTDALKIGLGQVSEGFRQDVLIPFTLPRTIYDLLAQAAQSGQLHCEANEERRGQGNQETGLLVSCFDDPRIGLSELWSCVS